MQFAIDTETTPITADEPVPRLVSVAIAGAHGCSLFAQHDARLETLLVHVFASGVAFANAPFDVFALWRRFPSLWPTIAEAYTRGLVVDVLTREKMIDIAEGMPYMRGGYGLGEVSQRRAGIVLDKSDPWRLQYGTLLGLEVAQWPAEAQHYAARDGLATWCTFLEQERWRQQHAFDALASAPHTACAALALYSQTLIGLELDPEHVATLDHQLRREIEAFTDACLAAGLARVGGTKKAPKIVRSETNAKAMLGAFEAAGVHVTRTKPTTANPDGQISLSEDALKIAQIPRGQLVEHNGRLHFVGGHPLDAYRRLGSRTAQRTKFLGPRLGRTLIRTRYDELKETGRTGSSGFDDDNPLAPGDNLQNQPKERERPGDPVDEGEPIFRRCHRARRGYRYIVSDWSGAELVTLAQVCLDKVGHSRLAEVLASGRNPHDELACTILGIHPSEFDKANREHKKTRQLAKAPNFGYPGGLGAKRFVEFAAREPYNLALTESEARRLKRQWEQTWPEMAGYHEWVKSHKDYTGFLTIIGPRFGIVRGGCTFPQACNFPFQGLAAAAAKTALWQLFLAGLDHRSPLFGSRQVLFVHDENVTEAPIDRVEEARAEQDRIMIEAFRLWCPDVPIKVESAICDHYVK